MAEVVCNANRLMNQLTLKVRITGIKILKARFWIGRKIILLAAWILGCGIKIEN